MPANARPDRIDLPGLPVKKPLITERVPGHRGLQPQQFLSAARCEYQTQCAGAATTPPDVQAVLHVQRINPDGIGGRITDPQHNPSPGGKYVLPGDQGGFQRIGLGVDQSGRLDHRITTKHESLNARKPDPFSCFLDFVLCSSHKKPGNKRDHTVRPTSPAYDAATSFAPACSSAVFECSLLAARRRLMLVYTTTTTTR